MMIKNLPSMILPDGLSRPIILLALLMGLAAPIALTPSPAHADTTAPSELIDDEGLLRADIHQEGVVREGSTIARRRVYRRTRFRSRHHHHGSTAIIFSRSARRSDTRVAYVDEPEVVVTRRARKGGPFMGMSLGLVGIDNDFDAKGGTGVGFMLGARDDNFALELEFLAASQPIERRGGLVQDLEFGGLAANARIYLPVKGDIEPYGLVGVGLYGVGLADDLQEPTFNTALNLGAGVDLRLVRGLAVGGRFVHHGFLFGQPESELGQTDDSWQAMGTMTVYF